MELIFNDLNNSELLSVIDNSRVFRYNFLPGTQDPVDRFWEIICTSFHDYDKQSNNVVTKIRELVQNQVHFTVNVKRLQDYQKSITVHDDTMKQISYTYRTRLQFRVKISDPKQELFYKLKWPNA